MEQKYLIRIAVLTLILIGFYFIYSYFFLFSNNNEEISQEQINENIESILGNLNSLENLNNIDARNGFWYASGNGLEGEGIFYFSLLNMAKSNFSESELIDFYEQIKESRIIPREGMRFVREEELPDPMQFYNGIHSFSSRVDSKMVKINLENKFSSNDYTSEDLWKLEYLSGLEGNYSERDELNARNCVEFGERCVDSNINIKIIGKVVDGGDNPIQSAKVEILSKDDAGFVFTDKDGLFEISTEVKELEKVRLKAYKRNFSDGISSFVVLNKDKSEYISDKIILESPIEIVTIDNVFKTITGKRNFIKDGNVFIVKTDQSVYEIPFNSLLKSDGTMYSGEMDVYLYEFTKETMPDSLAAVDTFDQVIGYAGNLMETFGMPYIQFFTPKGEELQVKKSNPIGIIYQIFHMKELYSASDKTHDPVTKEDIELLVDISSQRSGYPIDRQFLIDTRLFNFPAWWVFDRDAGIWNNEGMRVLNTDGLIETIFYTTRD
ncbi:MAG: hypothetical protein QGH26_01820 [Candidatus Pacebacteria bacterium]|jgi:hypothetical protein|nr:hypothetical protein [Parcubacteria group bacterium]MDP6249544.1 hypothetical protein [Candidatus Paceibacterota bacterium]